MPKVTYMRSPHYPAWLALVDEQQVGELPLSWCGPSGAPCGAFRDLQQACPNVREAHAVSDVHVEPRWRRKGIGLALYEHAARALGQQGAALVSDSCQFNETSRDALRVWASLSRKYPKHVWKSHAIVDGEVVAQYAMYIPPESQVSLRSNPFQRREKTPRGFTTSPLPFVRDEVLSLRLDPDGYGRAEAGAGLFHVTTNLSAVLAEGRLRSRRDLQQAGVLSAGLGGGYADEAADKVSVAVTRDGGLRVLKAVQLMADAVHGRIDSQSALEAMDDVLRPSTAIINDAREWMEDTPDDPDAPSALAAYAYEREWGVRLQDVLAAKPGLDLYDALRNYENHAMDTLMEWVSESYIELDDTMCALPVGFTESASKFARVNPDNIGLLQLAARSTARPESVPGECELRFDPSDLVIIGVWQASQRKSRR